MEAKLSFRYDREADILYIDKCPPYPDQESEELGDEVIARLNSDTGEIENLEVLFFTTRLLRSDFFQLPVAASLRRAEQENPRMHHLTEKELWERVRRLEGKTIFSLVRKKPNRITEVTDTAIIIAKRRSQPTRGKIIDLYESLWEEGSIQLSKEGSGPFLLTIVPAILATAVSDQIEPIPGVVGIRLKS